MFAADVGSLNPKYPVNTAFGAFMKAHGGTVLCSYGYGISPSSSRSAIGTADSFVRAGGKEGELDTSIPFGSSPCPPRRSWRSRRAATPFYAGLDDNSNYALAEALKQEGVKPKVMVFPTGFDPASSDPRPGARCRAATSTRTFHPFHIPNAGTKQMQSALEKYAHFSRPTSRTSASTSPGSAPT